MQLLSMLIKTFLLWYVLGMLTKEGHTVEFEEIEDWNVVEVWVNGEKVFECKIQDLDFGKLNSFILFKIQKQYALFKLF